MVLYATTIRKVLIVIFLRKPNRIALTLPDVKIVVFRITKIRTLLIKECFSADRLVQHYFPFKGLFWRSPLPWEFHTSIIGVLETVFYNSWYNNDWEHHHVITCLLFWAYSGKRGDFYKSTLENDHRLARDSSPRPFGCESEALPLS